MIVLFFQFLGYVAAFWFTCKILDYAYHSWKGDRVDTGCKDCDQREKELRKLRDENERMKHERLSLNRELQNKKAELQRVSDPARHDCDYRLLQQLNFASTENLEGINGIGPVKAKLIVQRRPFTSMQQVREILSDSLIRSARRWSSWRKP